jgi:pseudomonalisin
VRARLPLIGVGALLLAGAAANLPALATSAATGWVATHTQALKLNAQSLGSAPAAQQLQISVSLPLRNQAQLQQVIANVSSLNSPERGQFLSQEQVNAEFAPSQSTVAAVESYLQHQGFTNVAAEPDQLLVDATATVATAEQAFHTSIGLFNLNGEKVYANTAPAMVPASLSGDVVAVLGLSDIPMHDPLVTRTAASGSPDLNGFSPQAIQKAYDASSLPAASHATVAVITSGDMTSTITDLRKAESAWKLPVVPVTVEYAGPKSAIVNNNPLTGNAEWDLDTQISTGVAQSVAGLYIYDVATFTDSEVARGINLFVSQDKAQNLSASLGECDVLAFLDGAMITTDQAVEEAAAQGRSVFASTGDNGFACPEVASTGAPGGVPGVSWPADGEWTTGVGGTTLLADSDGNVSNEIAWIGGGGGVSPWEAAGPWTLQASPAGQSWIYFNQGGRSVPDVAADADPNTGVVIYTGGNGSSEVVGGTSVSSPLTMGLWARTDNADRGRLGPAVIDFYDLYNKANPATVENAPTGPVYIPAANPVSVSGFRDIVVGTNGLYVAKPGYDYTTGIGTVQAAALAKALG